MKNLFVFKDKIVDLENKKISFNFKLYYESKEYNFTEKLILPDNFEIINKDYSTLDEILKQLHLILGINYWKLTCAPDLNLGNIKLNEAQANFWNTVYTKGLGEFFYKNKIDFRNLIKFPFTDNFSLNKPIKTTNSKNSLLFFSGGKDSIVSTEILRRKKIDFTCFSVNPNKIILDSQKLTNAKLLILKRELDPLLFTLNSTPNFYNGHVPVNAILAFVGLLVTYLYDFKDLIISNEDSANYSNVNYLEENINHQWSKSFEFENMFHKYAKEILENINYFSLLRNLSEYEITEKLSKHSKYFLHFTSCNENFKIKNPMTDKKWCGECPKCLFTFIMLSVFLPRIEVLKIFEEDLLNKYKLLPIFRELLGIDIKPFECVGTDKEVKLALFRIYQKKEFNNSILMSYFINEILQKLDESKLNENVINLKSRNLIPREFK